MKKYSASKHGTMHELNITPLLDLAFVLLVIFIITTAPPVNEMDISLPSAAPNLKEEPTKKANFVSVDNAGKIFLNGVEMTLDQLLLTLVEFRKKDADLNVVVAGDRSIHYQRIIDVLDVLISANIVKVGLATDASGR
ncbi:MAG: biopolymer transporter ExbD [Verrucomicrobia bacterium]|nr:biopolymer transporter ExbD [Verrucomicrobiota bacterium]